MGFNYFDIGNIMPCGVRDGTVYYTLPSGKRIDMPTRLPVNIPEQTNLFISPTILFLLYDDENEYIGRKDGSISIFKKGTNLLVGLNNFDQPKFPNVDVCGYFKMRNFHENIYLFMDDKQTLGTKGYRGSGVLGKKVFTSFDLDKALIDCINDVASNTTHIFGIGGERYEPSAWNVQAGLREQNCPVFV